REVLLPPREDRADVDLAGGAVHVEAPNMADAFGGHLGELRFEPLGRERLAAQPPAAQRAPPEREIYTRILELGQDRLLDLIEGDGPSGDAMRKPLEGA